MFYWCIFFLICRKMALPYGLPQRCLQAVAACWLISAVLSFVSGGCSLVLFAYLAVVALPAVAIYSFMNVRLQPMLLYWFLKSYFIEMASQICIQVDPAAKAVLVTGCDSGFGHALALHLHDLGKFWIWYHSNTDCILFFLRFRCICWLPNER